MSSPPRLSGRPLTRSLPAVLRRERRRADVRLIVGRVVTPNPDAAHVNVEIEGITVTVPRLASYASPANGDACYLLATRSITIALGTVKP